jgi:D-psicose/D-tagatose/L-ribulose 3-epimerase
MKHAFRLSVQTVLPSDYRGDAALREGFSALRRLGFWGVELNMADPSAFDRADVLDFLAEYDLALSMYASGLTAKTFGLSLSASDEEVRAASVDMARRMIRLISGTGAGLIFGFMKGPGGQDPQRARERFRRSLGELAPEAFELGVPLVVEATNRYESTLANALDDTWELIADFADRGVEILPDTFHMNIEEVDMADAVTRHLGHFSSFHISDNNRFFPGYGAIDFGAVIGCLKRIGYKGRLGIEGNPKRGFVEDVEHSMGRIERLLSA